MRILIACLAFIGFFCSLVCNITTFLGVDLVQKYPIIWSLHVGIIILFFVLLFDPLARLHKNMSQAEMRKFVEQMPKSGVLALKICFVYAVINFGILMVHTTTDLKGGSPEKKDGRYVLSIRGKIIRPMTEKEYEYEESLILRLFSSAWMTGYLLPAIYYGYSRRKTETG